MYKLSEFVGAFEYPYNVINISGENYKIRKINKKQETMLFNSFEDIQKDLSKFVPTMYSLMIGSKQELIEKFKKSFGDKLTHIKTNSIEEVLELVSAKHIFEYLCKEAGITEGSFIDKCEEVLGKIKVEVNNSSTFLFKPFIEVLTNRGYKIKEIFEMPSETIIDISFKEIVFSKDANLLVYLTNRIYNIQKALKLNDNRDLGIPDFFRLFIESNQSESFDATEEIQKNIMLYDACFNVFGERDGSHKEEVKELKGKVMVDGVEVDLDDRARILEFIGAKEK